MDYYLKARPFILAVRLLFYNLFQMMPLISVSPGKCYSAVTQDPLEKPLQLPSCLSKKASTCNFGRRIRIWRAKIFRDGNWEHARGCFHLRGDLSFFEPSHIQFSPQAAIQPIQLLQPPANTHPHLGSAMCF